MNGVLEILEVGMLLWVGWFVSNILLSLLFATGKNYRKFLEDFKKELGTEFTENKDDEEPEIVLSEIEQKIKDRNELTLKE